MSSLLRVNSSGSMLGACLLDSGAAVSVVRYSALLDGNIRIEII